MAKEIVDAVFDAALAVIEACTDFEVRTSGSSVLVSGRDNSVILDGSNFTGSQSGATGRKSTCLVSAASDMLAISVSSAGSALRIALGTDS